MVRAGKYSIDRLIKRDEEAFQVFHETHVKILYQFGLRFIDDFEVVRDIVQEAFIAMWDRVEHFREEAHVKAFLYATVRHKAINYLRDRQVEVKSRENLARLQDNVEFRNAAIEEEMYDFLCCKIEMLPPMQREVLWMHVDGYSNEDIARRLNISVNTVLTHKQRAKSVLRDYLKDFSVLLLVFM